MNDDMINKKFGMLVVTGLSHKKRRIRKGKLDGHLYYYTCKCECGNETIVEKGHLKTGHTQSCGCLKKERTSKINGLFKLQKRMYYIWRRMIDRCFNKNTCGFKDYGGRGITVCAAWQENFINFYEWAINNGYREDLTIERIDVNGNYCPENCKWIPLAEQALNKRTSLRIELNGEVKTLKEWCSYYGFKRHMFYVYKKRHNLSNTEALIRCI